MQSIKQMKKIAFIINGTIRRKNKVKKNLSNIFKSNFELEFLETQKRDHAVELTKMAIENSCNILIAVGGDGTMNEVVNGYMNVRKEKRNEVIVGLLPMGTGNDFARSVGMKKSYKQLENLINQNQYKPIDIGQISYYSVEGELRNRYFNNIADIGIGAQTVALVNSSKKIFGGSITFMKSVIQSFLTYKNLRVSLHNNDFNWEGQVVSLCMANGRYFGGGLCIAPQANVDDGMFQLVIIGDVGVFDFLKYLPKLRKGEIINNPKIFYKKIKTCKFDALDKESPIDMDGEFIGYPPMDMKILPQELKFLREF
jgi:YegS/Rv2252/BmrU family lipid kinase